MLEVPLPCMVLLQVGDIGNAIHFWGSRLTGKAEHSFQGRQLAIDCSIFRAFFASLEYVGLRDTQVSDLQIDLLRMALPHCRILTSED